MGRFSQIGNNLDKITRDLLKDEKLVKLLTYTTPDAISKETPEDVYDLLMDKNIFRCSSMSKTQEEVKSIVDIYFNHFVPSSNAFIFHKCLLTADVFVHKSILHVNEGERLYEILGCIENLFDDETKNIGLGRLRPYHGEILTAINDNYSGFRITYEVLDFNK